MSEIDVVLIEEPRNEVEHRTAYAQKVVQYISDVCINSGHGEQKVMLEPLLRQLFFANKLHEDVFKGIYVMVAFEASKPVGIFIGESVMDFMSEKHLIFTTFFLCRAQDKPFFENEIARMCDLMGYDGYTNRVLGG